MESKQIKVSVIIPIFNTAQYLGDCIDSVLLQSLKEIEVICVNDASTDGSFDILETYKDNEVVKIINLEVNRGLGNARNIGLMNSTGEYVWFVDSDDSICNSNALLKMYKIAKKDELDVLLFDSEYEYEDESLKIEYGGLQLIRNDAVSTQTICGEDLFSYQMKRNEFFSCVPFYLFRRRFMLDNNLRFDLMIHEDLLFTPIALIMAPKARYINEKFYKYFRRNNSITTNRNESKHSLAYLHIIVEYMRIIESIKLKEDTLTLLITYVEMIKNEMIYSYLKSLKKGYEVNVTNNSYKVLLNLILSSRFPMIYTRITVEFMINLYKTSNIILYGAGRVSRVVQDLFDVICIKRYYIAVTDEKREGVFLLSELQYLKDDCLLIIASRDYYVEMSEYASQLGFVNQYLIG